MAINVCNYEELPKLPGIGRSIAEQIWQLRLQGRNIDEKTLATIPYVNTFSILLDLVDFTPIKTQQGTY